MDLLKTTFNDFVEDRCMQMAAALAFYTMLSLVPLLVLIVTIASLVMGPEAQQAFTQQASRMVGQAGAEELEELLNRGRRKQPFLTQPQASEGQTTDGEKGDSEGKASDASQAEESQWTPSSIIMNLASIVVLIFGATGIMVQLQTALNQVWEVEPAPEQSGIKSFFQKRLLSLGMILGIAFLLLASMLLTTILTTLGGWVSSVVGLGAVGRYAISEGVTVVIVTVLFAAIFKALPDAKVPWNVTWIGALMTAVLFTVGKFLIGLYLGTQDMSSTYGQAGSLVLVLVWTYYSSIVFLLGAEMTQVWAQRRGQEIQPADGAVRVIQQKKQVSPASGSIE